MGPLLVEAGSSLAPKRKELEHTLGWAEEHANSLAQLLNLYEDRVDSLRVALNALDTSSVDADSSKEINEFNAVAHASFDLAENKACDPSQIELSLEHPGRRSICADVALEQQVTDRASEVRVGRYTVAELVDQGLQWEKNGNEFLDAGRRCVEYFDVGHWDAMVSVCESRPFQITIGVVILVSTLFIAYEADTILHMVQEKKEDTAAGFRSAVDKTIIACFVVEVIMKILAYRLGFFIGPDWRWNIFDASNAIVNVFEIVAEASGGGTSVAGILRPLRSLKLLRMIKIFKFLRRFRELRLIAANLVNCASSLGWTVGLVAIVTYLFACIFMQAWVTRAKQDNGLPAEVFEDWGSTRAAMLSLFSGPTDGKDWIHTAAPLWDLGAPYYWTFLGYIIFFIFVISNIITSLIVETVLTHSGKDDCDVAMELLKRRHEYVDKVMGIFNEMGASSEVSTVSFDTFKEHLYDTSMLAFAEELSADPSDLEHLFELLSSDGKHPVDVDTFVVSCIRMRGAAKSIDMMDTLSTLVRLDSKRAHFEQWTAESLDGLQRDIHDKLDILLQQTQRQLRRSENRCEMPTKATRLSVEQPSFRVQL